MKTKHKRFLEIISNAKTIHDHPLNSSKSKQLFSFSKSKRFPAPKTQYNTPFYQKNPNLHKNTRTCSFGIGNKYDFTKKFINNPGPNHYKNEKNTIKNNLKKKKGKTFGFSREKCLVIGHKSLKDFKKVPGVGTYNLKNYKKSGKSCSFRIKTQISDKSCSLGPGKYNYIPTIGENAKLNLSVFRSDGFAKINPIGKNKSLLKNKMNFKNKENLKNGVFEAKFRVVNYDEKFRINKTGVFFNTKYSNSKCGKFAKGRRRYLSQKKFVPGPGQYLLPSDFGVYMSSLAVNKRI